MLSRLTRLAALAVALAVPMAAGAQDKSAPAKASKGPAVLVRVQSVNDLLKTADYIGTLLPEDARNQLKQGTDFAKALIDDKTGLAGINVKDPIGMYVTFGEEFDGTPPVVILVPIADRDTFLTTLEQQAMLKIEAPKDKDGVYKTEPKQAPFPVYFRFANGYAYATLGDAANIDTKVLAKPAEVLGGRPEHLISATLRFDRLPDGLRKMAIAGAENALANGKEQPVPNETPAMKEFKNKAIDTLAANLKDVLEAGEEAALRINVDPKAEEFALELELTGAKGKKLAKDIASIRENKSVVGGAVASPEAAFSLNLSVGLPADLKKSFAPVVDDALAQALKEANVPGEILTKAEPLIKALTPTLKAGELDLGASLVGPGKDDKYTLVAGIKVVDGKKLEGVVKDTVKKEVPPEASDLFKFDEESLSGGAKLHRVAVADHLDANATKVFGKSDIYLTFRDDLMLVAVGPDAKAALKKAVESKPADVGVFRTTVHLARLVPLVGEDADQLKAARAAAEKVFGKGGSKADVIKFSIDGGDSLKVKLSAQGKAIQFLAEVGAGEQKKEN
jgi:hypothetical protein